MTLPHVYVGTSLIWFFGFIVMRVWCIRTAVKAQGSGELLRLLFTVKWMLEQNRPWSALGRVAMIWLFAVPLLLFVVAVFLGTSSPNPRMSP